jgi:hypothetical protein
MRAFDEDANDPRTTWNFMTFPLAKLSKHADVADIPIHLVLIVVALIMMSGWRRMRQSRGLVVYIIRLVPVFILFCIILNW